METHHDHLDASAVSLIFDFDGTLADSLVEALRIVNELAPKYGFPEIDDEKVRVLRGMRTREAIKEVGIRPRQVPQLLLEAKSRLRERLQAIKPVEGIEGALMHLARCGAEMGILTSNSRENVDPILDAANLRRFFVFLETGSPLFGKARLLRKILDRNIPDAERKRVIYVGDETRDILAARRVGIGAAAVCWGANSRAALEAVKPDYLIETPAELSRLLSPPLARS